MSSGESSPSTAHKEKKITTTHETLLREHGSEKAKTLLKAYKDKKLAVGELEDQLLEHNMKLHEHVSVAKNHAERALEKERKAAEKALDKDKKAAEKVLEKEKRALAKEHNAKTPKTPKKGSGQTQSKTPKSKISKSKTSNDKPQRKTPSDKQKQHKKDQSPHKVTPAAKHHIKRKKIETLS